jgi:hypothetical protein
VRYVSPRPISRRRVAPVAEPRTDGIQMEPPHLAALTKEQREDLRLWHGRVNLLDRVKAMRGYALQTLGATRLGITGMVLGFTDVPPLVLSPLVPMYMWVKLWKRGGSLRASGLKLRRVLNMPSARRAFPPPPAEPNEKRLEKLAPRDVLDGPHGTAVRRAATDRSAILDVAGNLPKSDRALIPDLESTVDALVARVAQLAQMLHRLDQSLDPRQAGELDTRIAAMSGESTSPEDERRVALLRRQRATLDELVQRRAALARQLDSAGLALGNLRLDLIKVRSNGLQSSLADVTSATQEVRALSRDIDAMLDAVAEVKAL